MEKEESVPHITLIPFHPHCAQIIARSHKDHENLEHTWRLYSRMLLLPPLPLPCHYTERKKKKEIQMYLHYFPSCLLGGLSLAPAWGRSTDLPPSERGYKYRKEQATEITHRPHVVAESKGWAEKRMLTGKGQDKSRLGDGSARGTHSWSLFCQLDFQCLQKLYWIWTPPVWYPQPQVMV